MTLELAQFPAPFNLFGRFCSVKGLLQALNWLRILPVPPLSEILRGVLHQGLNPLINRAIWSAPFFAVAFNTPQGEEVLQA
jgi:hypothetical protein